MSYCALQVSRARHTFDGVLRLLSGHYQPIRVSYRPPGHQGFGETAPGRQQMHVMWYQTRKSHENLFRISNSTPIAHHVCAPHTSRVATQRHPNGRTVKLLRLGATHLMGFGFDCVVYLKALERALASRDFIHSPRHLLVDHLGLVKNSIRVRICTPHTPLLNDGYGSLADLMKKDYIDSYHVEVT